jgi:hypothetical protein
MTKDIYYSIKEFINTLENTQFTFKDATQAAKDECIQMDALRKNIIEATSIANSTEIVFIIDQLERYIIKLKKLIGDIPVQSEADRIPTMEEVKKEREQVLKLLQDLGNKI